MSDIEGLIIQLKQQKRMCRYTAFGLEDYIEIRNPNGDEAAALILAQQSTITTLRAERDEAMAALEPFAKAAKRAPENYADKSIVQCSVAEPSEGSKRRLTLSIDGIRLKHFRRAAAIYSKGEE